MLVRLGFSVAVHTDPEILLVDEVLAVGDMPFQRKCLERIERLRKQGTTLLLVSHDLDSIRNLCDRVIWLDEGRTINDGDPEIVVRQYLRRARTEGPIIAQAGTGRTGSGPVRIEQVRLLGDEDEERAMFFTGQPLTIQVRYQATERVREPVFGLTIHRSDGMRVAEPNTQCLGFEIPWVEGEGVVHYAVPSLPLLEGDYTLSVLARDREDTQIFDHHDRLYPFRVESKEKGREGVITLLGQWSCSQEQEDESDTPGV